MDLYFLDYDLKKKQERDYQKLYDALATYNAVSILESLWCLRCANTDAETLLRHFKQFIDDDDALCVSKVDHWAVLNTIGYPDQL